MKIGRRGLLLIGAEAALGAGMLAGAAKNEYGRQTQAKNSEFYTEQHLKEEWPENTFERDPYPFVNTDSFDLSYDDGTAQVSVEVDRELSPYNDVLNGASLGADTKEIENALSSIVDTTIKYSGLPEDEGFQREDFDGVAVSMHGSDGVTTTALNEEESMEYRQQGPFTSDGREYLRKHTVFDNF